MRAERATTAGGAHARCQAEFQEAGYTMVGGLVEPALAHTLWWYALERADAAGLEGDKLVGNGKPATGTPSWNGFWSGSTPPWSASPV